MKSEIIKLYKIKSNPDNPRLIKDDKFHKLVKSIKEFPEMLEIRPIVVNDELIVLGGNMRLKACKEAGLKEVPIIKASKLTVNKQREFIVKDNVGFGEWDWDLIANEWDAEQLDDWGLDLPVDFNVVEEAEEDNYTEPDDLKVDVVLGDLIEIGEHRLLCGDSTDETLVTKLLNGKKVDMLYTDPPYGVSVVGNLKEGKGGIGGANPITFKGSIGKGVICKEGSYKPIIGDDKDFDPRFLLSYSDNLFIWGANYFSDLLPIGQWVVWDKNRPEGTTFSDCELAWTNGKGIAVKKYKCTWNGMTREGESGKRVHPTQKPIKVCTEIIQDFSNENDIIMDLFLGGGSTMVASHPINRITYGMELDPYYCQVIIDRMQKLDENIKVKINGKEYGE